MKPQRFEIGQAVTPNKKNPVKSDPLLPSVVFGEIYHIKDYADIDNEWYCELDEIAGMLAKESILDPVITDNELELELNEIELEVTI